MKTILLSLKLEPLWKSRLSNAMAFQSVGKDLMNFFIVVSALSRPWLLVIYVFCFHEFWSQVHYFQWFCVYVATKVNWHLKYRGFSPYANFISANFIAAVFQNFLKLFGLCIFRAIHFHYYNFHMYLTIGVLGLIRFYVLFISLMQSIWEMLFLANATFSRS